MGAVLGRGRPARAEGRSDNIEAVYSLAGEFIATRSTADWLDILPRLEIPCGEIVELEAIPDDPHLQAVGFFRKETHPTEGAITVPDTPVQFGRTPAAIDRLQPNLGEHSAEILREAGLDEDEINSMRASGATT